MADVKILAVRGSEYLLDAGVGEWNGKPDVPMGRVYQLGDSRLADPLPVESILARGYWNEPPDDLAAIRGVIADLLAA